MRVLARIETPAHAGARDQARELADVLASDLSDRDIVLDCSNLLVGTPSFLDEIVKQVLVSRRARSLSVVAASARAHDLLERSAENRGLADRLLFEIAS
jgi:hypothetical protein